LTIREINVELGTEKEVAFMSSEWVDFQSIKQSVTLEMVLAHYGIQLRKVNQSSLRGTCPLPSHSSSKSGESFGANLSRSIWACQSQSCIQARQGRKGGGVIEFVAAMENVSIRGAALKLQNWLCGAFGGFVIHRSSVSF
jgi:hypothetical protein